MADLFRQQRNHASAAGGVRCYASLSAGELWQCQLDPPARPTARAAVEAAREQVAELLGSASASGIALTGRTEGDNLALFGLVEPGDHVISSTIEHHAVLNACKRLEEMGVAVSYVPCGTDGVVRAEAVRAALRPETRLISVMMANNETGALQPVDEIGGSPARRTCISTPTRCRRRGRLRLTWSGLAATC